MAIIDDEKKEAMPNEEAVKKATTSPLRVCCYGSSSSRTPEKYIDAAYQLGNTLAKRGHTCVNGAGSSGCMAAMNRGADDGGGHIVGVIHEKFVETGSSGGQWEEGMHTVFHKGSTHELVVASGTDLQERKRLLVEGADAIVVLPGGPGTWDEVSVIGLTIVTLSFLLRACKSCFLMTHWF
jgi:uncharacterized protein (TIGR00730 family)